MTTDQLMLTAAIIGAIHIIASTYVNHTTTKDNTLYHIMEFLAQVTNKAKDHPRDDIDDN